jgi:RNA 2',3'-cyclic 3'-phosphodiesterase
MRSSSDFKRLFFGFHVEAPWPLDLPKGRLIASHFRHMTIAFLGEMSFSIIEPLLATCPKPSFRLGPSALFDQVIFLPKHFPRVVAWHIHWFEEGFIETFQSQVALWLQENNLLALEKQRPLLPHVTLCRSPFSRRSWEKSFTPLPLRVTGFHLYESLGNLRYHSLWEHPFLAPFEEIPHTADVAFQVRGTTLSDLFLHAQLALCFKFPSLSSTLLERQPFASLEEVVMKLNEWISLVDQKMGAPLKAVSFHGEALLKEPNLIEWEMIADV